MSHRVLIVEDEEKLLDHLSKVLTQEGFSTVTCSSYRDLENHIQYPNDKFEVIVLDRLLHGKDSSDLVPSLRRTFPEVLVMILSAINTPAEKAALLDLGADDYLSKPFDGTELAARIRALLRRNRHELKIGNISLDLDHRTMKVEDRELPLTNKEFMLLRTLIQIPGKVFSKAFLCEQVWEMSAEADSNVVETTVNKIRKKMTEAGAKAHIKNTRNIGYWVEE